MVFFQPRFPTPSLNRLEMKMRSLLRVELESVRSGEGGFSPEIISARLPRILSFGERFHKLHEEWQREASKQFQEPIHCKKGCANCCQHYPMSVEPFEAIRLYASLRQRNDFSRILEDCFRRVQAFGRLMKEAGIDELDDESEDQVLQSFFALGLRCPILDGEGNCSEHVFRPITCRMYFSFTAPEFCVPGRLLTPENRSFHLCLPDEIEEDLGEWNTYFQDLNLSESLYEALLQINAWEGEGVFT